MKILTFLTLITVVFLFAGCGPARPKGMPETAPCVIAVLQDGKPVQGVMIALYREEGNGSMNIDGTTDETGVAEIKTSWGSYTTNGAPVGTCKVTADKPFTPPPETVTPEESALWTPAQGEQYERERRTLVEKLRIVPVVIADISTTPLTVSVAAKMGATLTIEINDYK